MASRRHSRDERALSEGFAVGVLLGITLLMTLSVGVYVVAVDVDEGPPTANFTFDHDSTADTLLVRYVQGETFPAEQVLLESGAKNATWAELARTSPNATLTPDSALQLSSGGSWGRPVTDASRIRILYTGTTNRTELAVWTANP